MGDTIFSYSQVHVTAFEPLVNLLLWLLKPRSLHLCPLLCPLCPTGCHLFKLANLPGPDMTLSHNGMDQRRQAILWSLLGCSVVSK